MHCIVTHRHRNGQIPASLDARILFDADKLDGDLAVRGARPDEELRALNGRAYALEPEMTVIADEDGVLSLGGVIGGEPSGCTPRTVNVFLECALFDPARTAATGRKLAVESDARYRFERGVDPASVLPGIEAATRLIQELCGGEASEIVGAGRQPMACLSAPVRRQVVQCGGAEAEGPGIGPRPALPARSGNQGVDRIGFGNGHG